MPVLSERPIAINALTLLESALVVRRRDRILAPLERRLAADMRRAFRAQRRELLRRLDSARPRGFVEAARPEEDWIQLMLPRIFPVAFDEAALATLELFTRPLDAAMRQALAEGSRVAIADLHAEISFDLTNTRARTFLDGRAQRQLEFINGTTKRNLSAIIADGVRAAKSYTAIAKEIRAYYPETAKKLNYRHIPDRATGIAVYELGAAFEQGNYDIASEMQSAGLTMEHAWLTVGDERVRPEHVGNEAAGWLPLNQAFPTGHMMPPTDGQCRCASLFRRAPS